LNDTVSHNGKKPVSSTSRDARARKSAAALRAALLDLLGRKPFDQITIRDICAEAGIHYATFFRHHQTKESLLDAIAAEQIRQLNELTIGVREADNYQAGLQALCEYVDEHRILWSILFNGGAGAAMREEWIEQSQKVAENEVPLNSWLPVELGTVCAATLIAETLAWWVAQPRNAYGSDEVANILTKLLSSSILSSD